MVQADSENGVPEIPDCEAPDHSNALEGSAEIEEVAHESSQRESVGYWSVVLENEQPELELG